MIEDAVAALWHETRRLAHLIAELASRVDRLEHDTEDEDGEER